MTGHTRATTPERAYRALSHAADQIGSRNWAKMAPASGRHKRLRYVPTPAHRSLCDGMLDVMAGRITPAAAMGLLWTHEVMRELGRLEPLNQPARAVSS